MVKSEKHKLKQLFPRSSILLMFLFPPISISAWQLALHVDTGLSIWGGKDWWHLHWPAPHPPSFLMNSGSFSSHFYLCHTHVNLHRGIHVFLVAHSGEGTVRDTCFFHLPKSLPTLLWEKQPLFCDEQILPDSMKFWWGCYSEYPTFLAIGVNIKSEPGHIYTLCCQSQLLTYGWTHDLNQVCLNPFNPIYRW